MTDPLLPAWNLDLGCAKRLVKALENVHAGVAAALPGVPESRWSEPPPIEDVRNFLPTPGDRFVFGMAAHENMHLGRVSAWRRVQGIGRV